MNNFKFELGKKAVDSVVGLIGTITARHNYITGCNRYTIEASDSTGRPLEWTVDEDRLSICEE